MKKTILFILIFCVAISSIAQKPTSSSGKDSIVIKKDRKKDVLLQTTMGDITIRLSDSTPLHRDNFLKLVKVGFYDSLLFHRVMNGFMIQSGDPNSKAAPAGMPLGNGGPGYTIPSEFKETLFHKKGVIAAARQPDNVNPEKASSGSQFYIAQGKVYTDAELDIMEQQRLQGKKIPELYRTAYKTVGGIPHLDRNYTVYGEVIKGEEVIDKIASVEVSKGRDLNRPIADVMIITTKLIKRKKK
jgi:peptidyl-prolyl cis-trans isomerase B (cyclophilin B)